METSHLTNTHNMITIKDTHFTSDINLADMLMVRTKEYMLDICKKLDLYVSPNVKKEETARRLAEEILDNPLAVLCSLSKTELQLVKEFVDADPNQYITRKMRQTFYKLQKFHLVLTYEDEEAGIWKMLMPDCVRESLATSLPAVMSIVEKAGKIPKYKELRMLAMLNSLERD